MMSIRSVHSRRTVPIQRSANEFARRACGGVLITSMPSALNTASKGAANLLSRSRSRNRSPAVCRSRSISTFRACWATQALVGWAVTPGDVDLAGGDPDEEKHSRPVVVGVERAVAGVRQVLLGKPVIHAGPIGRTTDHDAQSPTRRAGTIPTHRPTSSFAAGRVPGWLGTYSTSPMARWTCYEWTRPLGYECLARSSAVRTIR